MQAVIFGRGEAVRTAKREHPCGLTLRPTPYCMRQKPGRLQIAGVARVVLLTTAEAGPSTPFVTPATL